MDKVTTAAQQSTDILSLFQNEFASTVIPVYIKSLDKVVEFREISVNEQKALTKTQIENQNRPATIYRAFNSLIESAMITKNIDVMLFTEADRYSILFNLYQTAFLDKPHEFTCKHCNNKFMTSIDAKAVNDSFAGLDCSDKVYTLQDATRFYIFTCNYPTIKRVTTTLDVFQRKYMSNTKADNVNMDVIAMMESVDYMNSFIKSLTIERVDKTKPAITANFEEMTADNVLNTLAIMPQHIMLAEDKGITTKILNDFITPINTVFAKQQCPVCHEEFEGQIGSIPDFLS